jgi:hypothetical protein
MRWCDRVPIFQIVIPGSPAAHGQKLYEHDEKLMIFGGYAPGCGRRVEGGYCAYCRQYMPAATDREAARSRAKPARARV